MSNGTTVTTASLLRRVSCTLSQDHWPVSKEIILDRCLQVHFSCGAQAIRRAYDTGLPCTIWHHREGYVARQHPGKISPVPAVQHCVQRPQPLPRLDQP